MGRAEQLAKTALVLSLGALLINGLLFLKLQGIQQIQDQPLKQDHLQIIGEAQGLDSVEVARHAISLEIDKMLQTLKSNDIAMFIRTHGAVSNPEDLEVFNKVSTDQSRLLCDEFSFCLRRIKEIKPKLTKGEVLYEDELFPRNFRFRRIGNTWKLLPS